MLDEFHPRRQELCHTVGAPCLQAAVEQAPPLDAAAERRARGHRVYERFRELRDCVERVEAETAKQCLAEMTHQMLNEKQHQVNKRCVRKAGFLLGNSAFFVQFDSWDSKVGCWVSLRIRRHEAMREYYVPFTFTVFSEEPFNPTYEIGRNEFAIAPAIGRGNFAPTEYEVI